MKWTGPWESKGKWKEFGGPYAQPFSDGVWYDPKDKCFQDVYMERLMYCTCYNTSKDGLKVGKAELDVVPGRTSSIGQSQPTTSVA